MRLALLGDVHLRFDEEDVALLDEAGYDAVLFTGDLAGYSHRGGLAVARRIARLRTPAIVIPGNHDGVLAHQLLAEMMRHEPAIALGSRGQAARVQALRRALGPVVLGGFSVHPLGVGAGRIDCIAARPHSFGGPHLAFRPYLREAFGVDSMQASAQRLEALVRSTSTERIHFLAHNGPSGLGARRHDPWGCDFRRGEGDFGDPDLRAAIDTARTLGKHVVAVLAGHMHHALRGGGQRTWIAREHGTLYVNAARVPRIFERDGVRLRHRVEVTIEGDRAEAREILAPERVRPRAS